MLYEVITPWPERSCRAADRRSDPLASRAFRLGREQQVEQHGEHAAQADALQREAADGDAEAADAGNQRHRDDA